MDESPDLPPVPSEESIPWTMRDVWIGILGMALIAAVSWVLAGYWKESQFFINIGSLVIELLYGMPVIIILFVRKTTRVAFGLRKFHVKHLVLGCGMLFSGYCIIMVHNIIIMLLNLNTQGQEILELFTKLESPGWLMFTGAIVAPLVEETFFRGFVFAGMRQEWGWKTAAFASSAIFAIFHLSPISLIPTFVLGLVFAVLYQQSKSIWPSIILHFMVNSFSLTMALIVSKMGPFLGQYLPQ